MSTVEIDGLANWYAMLKQLMLDKAQIEEEITKARSMIEDAMGSAETATIGGEPVIRWSHVITNRFDQKAAKTMLTPEQVEACTKPLEFRRFTIVDN